MVLKTVVDRLKECLREYDYIGRYGGEEFLVVLGDADYKSAVTAADQELYKTKSNGRNRVEICRI